MKNGALMILLISVFSLACLSFAGITLNNSISNDPYADIMDRINGVVCIFFNIVTYVTAGVCTVVIMYAGIKYLTASDGQATTNAKNMIAYALAAMVLIALACPVVDYLIIGTKIVPFQQKCNCFGSGPGSASTSTTTPQPTCHDGTPPGQCSASPAYTGYKCILSGNNLVLVPDSACGKAGPTTTTTSTTAIPTSSTTTTSLADHGICYNAESGGLCAGLDILTPGLQADCCDDWTCCCTPASGTCTPP